MSVSSFRRLSAVVVVLAACAVSSGSVASAAPSPRRSGSAADVAGATRVHRVSPLDGAGNLSPDYTVGLSRRGYCWTSSSMRPDLYRCFRGNLIEDPCWHESQRHSVVCLAHPWSHRVTRLRLTRPLPDTSPGRARGWGLGLRSGNVCQFASGAHDVFHGHVVTYNCRRNWVLLDEPARRHPVWTIATARRVGDHYVARGRLPLSRAWFAKGP